MAVCDYGEELRRVVEVVMTMMMTMLGRSVVRQ